MITLSIIIPVFNVEQYVGMCLDSICSQIVAPYRVEIIIINDGSTDDSLKIVRHYETEYPFIRCYNQENRGLSATRNRGIGLANGDYVWFIDSDDWLVSNALLQLFSYMGKFPEAEVFVTPLTYCLGNKPIMIDIPKREYDIMDGKCYSSVEKLRTGASPRYIIKRALLIENKIRFIEGILHEDGPFGYLLMWYAKKIVVLPNSLYCYRQHEKSIMHSGSIKSSFDLITGHKYMMRFISENKISLYGNEWFFVLCSKLLYFSYSFVKPIWNTEEFRHFEEREKKYIAQERKRVMPALTGRNRIINMYFLLFPKLTIEMLNGISSLKRLIKQK